MGSSVKGNVCLGHIISKDLLEQSDGLKLKQPQLLSKNCPQF